MKTLALTLTCLMTCISVFGQVQEAKFSGEAALLNEDGTLTMLQNDFGSLSMSFNVSTNGESSTVKIQARETIQIVVKASNINESPAKMIVAFKMKQKKGKRIASMGAYGVKSKDIIHFKGDTYGESSYILTFENLEPGEYGIWYGDKFVKNSLGEHPMAFFCID